MPFKTTFPLPRASQTNYTKYFKHVVGSGPLSRYKILWVGQPLPCRFKSDSVKTVIGPQHVFILKKGFSFAYGVIDSTDTVHKLPKKFFATCFPGIQHNKIPPGNMIKIKLTRAESIEVPYIPSSFLQQKKMKTTRPKSKRTQSTKEVDRRVENIDFSVNYPQWHVLNNTQLRDNYEKKNIMSVIRMILQHSDASNDVYQPVDPFEGLTDVKDIMNDQVRATRLKTIIGFISHYCRSELGCSLLQNIDADSIQQWIECLNCVPME